MTNEERAVMAAQLESIRNKLEAIRKELESARDRDNKIMDTLKMQAGTFSQVETRDSTAWRYLLLIAIAGLAAWQVYMTLQLKGLLAI